MNNSDLETIFALSSATGRAGVAVVRVTGSRAGSAIDRLTGDRPPPRYAALRTLRDPTTGTEIDRGIVLWLPGPESFTGEDCAEFHTHGGPAVISALLTALAAIDGFRLAEPGEFSRRAFANGKMDLAQAEGLADLIVAETEAQRRQALTQAGGTLSSLYDDWRTRLIDASALTEAAIDFSDEGDVASDAIEKARTAIMQVLPEIQAHLDDNHRGEIVRDGFRVALVGPPNVGKSSLLNALARRDVAIVSAEAGTTRDVVDVRLDLNGYPVVVSDTAGLRAEAGDIEREGMRRAREAAHQAQLVLWLVDATDPSDHDPAALETPDGGVVTVVTKADLVPVDGSAAERGDVVISSKTGAGLTDLIALITGRVAQRLDAVAPAPALTQLRHRQAVRQCVKDLETFLAGDPAHAELRAEDLRRAATALGRITGRVDVEDVLDQVFGRFCIGK